VYVYGLFNYGLIGNIAITYTVDGSPSSVQYNVDDAAKSAYNSSDLERRHTLMYSSPILTGGDHTLIVEVNGCTNQFFALDYILYRPSFDSLLTKPHLLPQAPSSNSTGASTTFTTTLRPTPTEIGDSSAQTEGNRTSSCSVHRI
jgi:hypothetical protein